MSKPNTFKRETKRSPLTNPRAKWRIFAEEYCVDRNPRRAAIRAGVSLTHASTVAKRWMKEDAVLKVIEELTEQRAERLEIEADDVVLELQSVAFADIADYVTWNDGVLQIKPAYQITPEARRAIKKVKMGKYGVEIEMHDKMAALEKLAQHLGMFIDRKDWTFRFSDASLLSDEDLARIIAEGGIDTGASSDGDPEPPKGSNGVSRIH